MTNESPPGIKSTASINGHPLHPVLIPFPIAMLVGALVTDLVYLNTSDPFWARASFWLIGAGIATALLAAVLGLIDFVTVRRVRELSIGWWHMILNVLAVLVSGLNLYLRLGNEETAIVPLGLAMSAVVTGLLTISGWLGGELTFRHKIGVTGTTRTEEYAEGETRRAYGGGD